MLKRSIGIHGLAGQCTDIFGQDASQKGTAMSGIDTRLPVLVLTAVLMLVPFGATIAPPTEATPLLLEQCSEVRFRLFDQHGELIEGSRSASDAGVPATTSR